MELEWAKELSKPEFLRTKSNQEIKSAINLINNRPFKEEITKILEQNLHGVEVISDERYVSRVEVQTKEDLEDVAEAGVSLTALGRVYTIGKNTIDLANDLQTGNFEKTINNGVDRLIPKGLRKIGVPKKSIGGGSDISDLIGSGISLERDLNE